MKLLQEPEQDLDLNPPQTPRHSYPKPGSAVISHNKSGAKSPRIQESMSRTKVPIETFHDVPPKVHDLHRYVSPGKTFQIDPTITRVRIFRWLLLWSIKVASIVTAIVFWLATILFIKLLVTWETPYRAFAVLLSHLKGLPLPANIWRYIFLGSGYVNGPHLRVAVHASSYLHSATHYSASIPILLGDPLVWLFVMFIMVTSHSFLQFAHDCLSKLSPSTRAAN